ncbi:MAG: hypothetical protein COX57_06560 [Alphaproteobacteria bacterium CG_4_10_14_0_2_um_filter_63_37]|nr:MAG: hypothetical protein AUJ55_09195 [Proteobacteria bacterium CG1_02_64_396]PJA24816.1 MAG: hypothetical protein COX57_06560 [Alphaproteobacteria bacterium CG_4_10_14_0_2_um_filter_63_37]
MFAKTVAISMLSAGLCGLATVADAKKKAPEGPDIFDRMCFKCHMISGVPPFDQPDSTKKDLRQALSDPNLITDRVTNGFVKGTAEMPAFRYKKKFMSEEVPILMEWFNSVK